METEACQLVYDSFSREEGSPLPVHKYDLSTFLARKGINDLTPSPSPISSKPSTKRKVRTTRRQWSSLTLVHIDKLREM